MYRLSIDIGVAFTSASYEVAAGSEALQLSPSAAELPSTRFLTEDGLQADSLAETLRGMVATASQQLGEAPAAVEVTYPRTWDSNQLLLLWEALVLAGIPDALTRAAADPQPSATASPVDPGPPPKPYCFLRGRGPR